MVQPTLSEQTRQTLEAFVANLPDDQQEVVGKAFEALMASDSIRYGGQRREIRRQGARLYTAVGPWW